MDGAFIFFALSSFLVSVASAVVFYIVRIRSGSADERIEAKAKVNGWQTEARPIHVDRYSFHTSRGGRNHLEPAYKKNEYIIIYEYVVNGIEYHQSVKSSEQSWDRLRGKSVTVYYDADNPEKAVLATTNPVGQHRKKMFLQAALLFFAMHVGLSIIFIILLSQGG